MKPRQKTLCNFYSSREHFSPFGRRHCCFCCCCCIHRRNSLTSQRPLDHRQPSRCFSRNSHGYSFASVMFSSTLTHSRTHVLTSSHECDPFWTSSTQLLFPPGSFTDNYHSTSSWTLDCHAPNSTSALTGSTSNTFRAQRTTHRTERDRLCISTEHRLPPHFGINCWLAKFPRITLARLLSLSGGSRFFQHEENLAAIVKMG